MSGCRSASTCAGTSASTAAASPRLHGSASVSPPSVSRKAFSLSALEPDTASRAPWAASACAIAEPIPPEAPVTRAVMPVRSNIFENSCDLPVHAETRRRGGFMVVDDATDVFLERGSPEVDEKTDGLDRKTKIGQMVLGKDLVKTENE